MFHDVLRIPITSPAVLVPVDVAAAIVTAWVVVAPLARRGSPAGGRGRIGAVGARVVALPVGAALGLVVVWWTGDVQDLFGVSFTPVTRMWIAFACAAAALLVVVLVQGGWTGRIVAAGAAAAVALAAGLGVNVDFGAYRDLQQVVTTNPYPARTFAVLRHPSGGAVVDAAEWRAPARMPAAGAAASVRIPGTVSHFHARRAVVWLPPAARTAHPPTLPVLIALSGQPGQPADLFQSGALGRDLDRYATAHDGLAPIVVAPDQLGAPARNPMCVDSRRLGRSATYVMTDTVRWIRAHLPVGSGPSAWGILGFSEGATCTMQFSTAHPGVFGTALAISSEAAPRDGTVQHTLAEAFDGSSAAYRAAAPAAIMHAHGHYPGHLTVFGYGQDDARFRTSTLALRTAAERVGMRTSLIVSPGSAHDWNTVRYVLAHGLPQVIGHLGLPTTAGPS